MIPTKKYIKRKNKTKHKHKIKHNMINKRRTKNNYKNHTYKIRGGMFNGMFNGMGNSEETSQFTNQVSNYNRNQRLQHRMDPHQNQSSFSLPSFGTSTSQPQGKADAKPSLAPKVGLNPMDAASAGASAMVSEAIANPGNGVAAGLAVINKKNPNFIYKFLINTLLDRFVGNTKYLFNVFKKEPNKIDVICIIDYDNKNANSIKILPYYIKLCRLIKTYYNKVIIKSDILLDESLSVKDIDTQAHFMKKREKLYSEHTYTDHTQDLINLLIDNVVQQKIDKLHANIPKNIGNMNGGAMKMLSSLKQSLPSIKSSVSSKLPMTQNAIPTANPIQNAMPNANPMPGTNAIPTALASMQQGMNNNDSIHYVIEEMFNDKIGESKCPVDPNLKVINCPGQPKILPEVTGKQYLILDILYTIYKDKHELYTTKSEKNPEECILEAQYNNLDNSIPGVYVTARNTEIPGMPGGM